MKPIRKLIRADGAETELHGPHALQDVRQMIGADDLEMVRMDDGVHVMLIARDDKNGSAKVNQSATDLFGDVYRPSWYPIRGDVVIVPDSDYAREA